MHDVFPTWFDALYARHTEALQFAEIRRALQALSTLYVHQREKVAARQTLEGRGKRAAFALFYAPLHYLTVRRVSEALRGKPRGARRIIDVGCGTGAAGAALAQGPEDHVTGIDVNAWALQEARWSWRYLGVRHAIIRGDASRLQDQLPKAGSDTRCTIALAYVVNELAPDARNALRRVLLGAARAGHEILLLEPIARRISPWWDDWCAAFAPVGGRTDDWRFELPMPEKLRLLDKAGGMRHGNIKARSLYVPGLPNAAARAPGRSADHKPFSGPQPTLTAGAPR